MKRFFSAMAALLLAFTITACSNSAPNNNQEQNNTTEPTATATNPEKTSGTNQTKPPEQNTENTTNNKNTIEEKTTSAEKSDTKPSDATNNTTTVKNPVTTTQKPQTTTSPSKQLPNYSPESEIVDLSNIINTYRERNGLNKLTLDPALCKMAYIRAREQTVLKGHTRPDNSKYFSILDEYNYEYNGCGENIAFVWDLSADDIFNKWKGSSAHNGNMIESRWTKTGIALYKNTDGSYTIVHLFAC